MSSATTTPLPTTTPIATTTPPPYRLDGDSEVPALNYKQRLFLSGISALLFFILSHPIMYKLVNFILGMKRNAIASDTGCPKPLGVLVHGIVFACILRAILEIPLRNYNKSVRGELLTEMQIWQLCILNGLLFGIIGIPWLFGAMNKVFNGCSLLEYPQCEDETAIIAYTGGCPTLMGLAVHAIVYMVLDMAILSQFTKVAHRA